jgi:hypothetical protein
MGFVEMKSIAEFTGCELRWVQPHVLKREYELKIGDDVAATLNFTSSFSSFAIGESREGSWSFKRVGIWQRTVTVRELASDTELAVFKRNIWKGGGTVELPSGLKYLTTPNFWQSQYDIWTEDRRPLIHYRIGGIWRPSAATLIEPGAANLPELPWMTLLGWYLVLLMRQDAAAAAA